MTENVFPFSTHQELISSQSIAGRPLKDLVQEIQEIYLGDDRPWIIGFSGGKDSTTILALIYTALQNLPPGKAQKPIYVVSSDTLVETPVVVDLMNQVIKIINTQGEKEGLPISAHVVHPQDDQTFWTNLLGRGYPAPTQSFRWCTERMKINPVTSFITEKVADFGEVIVVLGSRSQESASRSQVIAKHRIDGSSLSRHSTLPNAYTYMPIQDWSADEVWMYLLSAPSPWGGDNMALFKLYKEGSEDGECPLVVDTSTNSCGNSRFGCWTCTVVTKDKAIHGLIESGMDWMRPLLEFRNELHKSTIIENKTKYRNYKRRTGKVSYARAKEIDDDTQIEVKHIPGPYWMDYRKKWIKDLLQIQKDMSDSGHDTTLIHDHELQAIRQQWLRDPNEPDWPDSLPKIFSDVYPDRDFEWIENDAGAFTEHDAELLELLGEKFDVPAQLIMKLLEIEISSGGLGQRRGVLGKLESMLKNDWETLENIKERKSQAAPHEAWSEKLEELQSQYEEAATL